MIVVFGTVCIDRLRGVPELPAPGGYVEAQWEEVLLGGEAANTANALRAWGDSPTLVTHPLGDDLDGEILRSLVRARGLDPIELRRETAVSMIAEPGAGGAVTPVCDVYITPDGERTMFGKGFTESEKGLSLDRLPLSAGDWFTVEPNMPVLAREAARRAGAAGMRVWAMDFVRPDEELPPGSVWQASVDSLGVSADRDVLLALAESRAMAHEGVAIITAGGDGLAVASPEGVRWLPAFPAPSVVDTTGAGDAFRAGCLHVLDRGGSWDEALAFGRAAGALACATVGATSRVPTLGEIADLTRR